MDLISILIGAGVGVVAGIVIMVILQKSALKAKTEAIRKKAEDEGESVKKDKILQAKEKFLQLKEEHENAVRSRERTIQSAEDKIKAKEKTLNQKIEEVNRKSTEVDTLKKEISTQLESVEAKKGEISKLHQKQVLELSKISGLSSDDAKKQMMEALKDEARTDAMAYIKEIVDEAKINASQ
jgi:ribonuclease Y